MAGETLAGPFVKGALIGVQGSLAQDVGGKNFVYLIGGRFVDAERTDIAATLD
jgi:hypothetical protein